MIDFSLISDFTTYTSKLYMWDVYNPFWVSSTMIDPNELVAAITII